jgi:hypothetical protein
MPRTGSWAGSHDCLRPVESSLNSIGSSAAATVRIHFETTSLHQLRIFHQVHFTHSFSADAYSTIVSRPGSSHTPCGFISGFR